jgi:hypothetical protein
MVGYDTISCPTGASEVEFSKMERQQNWDRKYDSFTVIAEDKWQ